MKIYKNKYHFFFQTEGGGGRAGPGSAFALHVHDRHPEIKRYQFEITNDFCLKTEQLFK